MNHWRCHPTTDNIFRSDWRWQEVSTFSLTSCLSQKTTTWFSGLTLPSSLWSTLIITTTKMAAMSQFLPLYEDAISQTWAAILLGWRFPLLGSDGTFSGFKPGNFLKHKNGRKKCWDVDFLTPIDLSKDADCRIHHNTTEGVCWQHNTHTTASPACVPACPCVCVWACNVVSGY